ncbi:MAG TPA: phytanoyl-CoA dioxygenase family protein [Dongiaceae bacterium]|jgi:hypothetical protein
MGEPGFAGQRQADLEVRARLVSGHFLGEDAMNPVDAGFEYFPTSFNKAEIASLEAVLAAVPSQAAGRRWAGRGLEMLLQHPALVPVMARVAMLLPQGRALRAVAFKKDADANWFVPAHQDRSIPIPSSELPEGFSRATRKGDGWQAEAPMVVLQAMRNFRIFIDDATTDDGPLEVIPGSHRLGRIEQAAIPGIVAQSAWHPLTGHAGDVVMLSPLLLHRSVKATSPRGRRVLQIECVSCEASELIFAG